MIAELGDFVYPVVCRNRFTHAAVRGLQFADAVEIGLEGFSRIGDRFAFVEDGTELHDPALEHRLDDG